MLALLLLVALVGDDPKTKGLPSGKPDYPPGKAKLGETADDAPLILTSAQVKKKFKGLAKWNQKKGELTLEYDFARKGVLGDWDTGKKKPKIEGHTLILRGGDEATHSVNWATVNVSCVVAIKQFKGEILGTTAGATFSAAGANLDGIYVWTIDRNNPAVQIAPVAERTGVVALLFQVEEDRVSATFGNGNSLSKKAEKPMGGNVKLYGGTDRYGFAKLTMTGTLDQKWAREFFK